MRKLLILIAASGTLAATGCTTMLGRETGVPVPLQAGVTSTYDEGGPGQYPATLHHYDATVAEDVAGDDCEARGGSLIDDAAERFVCVTD